MCLCPFRHIVTGSVHKVVANVKNSESWFERIELWVTILTQLGILAISVTSLIERQWSTAFSGSVVLFLTFVPGLLERKLRVRLPMEVSLFACLFLFASFALGEVSGFYEQVWWWDLALHGSSAFVTGLIGFLAVFVFYMTHRIRIAPIYVAAISFGAAITVGTIWEIFEFLMDRSFGLNMQRSGLVDTMTDLIVNAIGALLAAAVGYYYVRQGDLLLGRSALSTLVERGRSALRRKRDGVDR